MATAPKLIDSSARPIVGIDVGRKSCHVNLLHTNGLTEAAALKREDVAAWIMDRLPATSPPALIALELTGALALPIIDALESTHHTLLIAQHTDSLALRGLLRQRKKTDRLDARLIARLASLTTNPATAELVGAHLVPWQQIATAIRGRAHARHLIALTREKVRWTLRGQTATTPEAKADAATLKNAVEERVKAAEHRLEESLSPNGQLLTSLPGVTKRRAGILDAAIGDPHRFKTPDALVNYLVITPPFRPSSGMTVGAPVRRKGLDLLHTELYMWAMGVARNPAHHGEFAATFQRVKARSGSGRAGLWAAKRKLIRTVWGILTSGTPYRLAKPDENANATPAEQKAKPRTIDSRKRADRAAKQQNE